LAYSPDSQTLVSASGDPYLTFRPGEVKLWEVATGGAGVLLPDLSNTVSAVAFSPDGKRLALACPYAPEIWNVATRTELAMLPGHRDRVRAVAFALNGRILASGSSDRTIKLWRPPSRACITFPVAEEGISCLAVSSDGRLLATSGDNFLISLWDNNLRKRVATGHDSFLISLWDTKLRKRVATLEGHNVKSIAAVAFSPDAKTLVSGGADGTVRLWNVTSRREVAMFRVQPAPVVGVFFNQQGTALVAIGADGTISSWDTRVASRSAAAQVDAPAL
jgi:WD40 repeat protein